MNAKGEAFAADLLDAVFFDVPLPFSGAASFRLSLHYGSPEGPGGMVQNEVAYLGYQAIDLPRRADVFVRDGNVVRNLAEVRFPLCDELETKTHRAEYWALRTPGGGVKYQGRLNTPIDIKAMTRPVLLAGAMEVSEA